MIKNTQGLERAAEERPREGFLEEEEAFELGLKEREREALMRLGWRSRLLSSETHHLQVPTGLLWGKMEWTGL